MSLTLFDAIFEFPVASISNVVMCLNTDHSRSSASIHFDALYIYVSVRCVNFFKNFMDQCPWINQSRNKTFSSPKHGFVEQRLKLFNCSCDTIQIYLLQPKSLGLAAQNHNCSTWNMILAPQTSVALFLNKVNFEFIDDVHDITIATRVKSILFESATQLRPKELSQNSSLSPFQVHLAPFREDNAIKLNLNLNRYHQLSLAIVFGEVSCDMMPEALCSVLRDTYEFIGKYIRHIENTTLTRQVCHIDL